jgi:hypothetical protein
MKFSLLLKTALPEESFFVPIGHQSPERFSAMAVEKRAGPEQKYSKCGRMDMAFFLSRTRQGRDFIFIAPQMDR